MVPPDELALFAEPIQVSARCVIPGNHKIKIGWDLGIMVLLLITTAIIPVRLAFVEEDTKPWQTAFFVIDGIFFFDIILWFFTSYQDQNNIEIVSHKKIAINYLKTWFMIDFFSVLPIDVILANYQDFNKLLRLVRIGKMYKLVRLFRLVKILKLVKSNKRLMNQFSEKMRISAGTERLAFFSVFFVIFLHVSSCLFIMIGKSNNDDEPSWLDSFNDKPDEEVFVCSIYFVLTTTSTVGYGDITPVNTIERLYGCALMLIGVLSFTFISGALSSILSSYDSRQA